MRRILTAGLLVWWLFYFPDGADGWRPFQSYTQQQLCERAAMSFRAGGIHAVCIESRSY